jgi:hypothetical protein
VRTQNAAGARGAGRPRSRFLDGVRLG